MASCGATVAQFSSDATAIGKLVNANGMPYQLAITDSLADIVGDLSALNGDSHVVSITATSGSATLSGGVGVNAPAFSADGLGDEPHRRRGARLLRGLQPGRGFDDQRYRPAISFR